MPKVVKEYEEFFFKNTYIRSCSTLTILGESYLCYVQILSVSTARDLEIFWKFVENFSIYYIQNQRAKVILHSPVFSTYSSTVYIYLGTYHMYFYKGASIKFVYDLKFEWKGNEMHNGLRLGFQNDEVIDQ